MGEKLTWERKGRGRARVARWARVTRAVVVCTCILGGAGLTTDAATDAASAIYARATNYLDFAVLFKPRTTNEEDLSFKLAPFIFQETKSAAARDTNAIGRVVINNESMAFDSSQPAVYFSTSTPLLHGRPHAQLAFVWLYERGPGGSKHPIPVQGIRLTLDSSGEPVIWEVLADSSGRELIFVSQKLESAAAWEFGAVLPGRRHAIERGTNEAPGVVVSRVIDDAPMPMGPMVYLDSKSRSAITVSCRCMPVQAHKLARTETYDLLPLETVAGGTGPVPLWPERNLERCLRLPNTF